MINTVENNANNWFKSSTIYHDLKNKVVFITGGGSGIGGYLTAGFVNQGAKVAFVSLRKNIADELCESIAYDIGVKPLGWQCDVTNVAELQNCITQVEQKLGPIDILINNVANDRRHDIADLSVADWDKSMSVNLRSYFFATQAVVKNMQANKQGNIINIGSNSANLGIAGFPAYVAAKAAIAGMTKALARELGPDDIRVNCLVPGWVMTKKQQQLWVTDEAISQCLAEQSLKALIQPEDIAKCVLFLASKDSKMITGQSVIVDGGRV